ncbi:response regulator transcription factor [Marmoricola sp. RAF53]|uniref:helix-turn-helix transcriptional regulator n=1 Tax=Marmoricola sp. RAF53 TaxID=3233059 RepID=UPI003F94BD25
MTATPPDQLAGSLTQAVWLTASPATTPDVLRKALDLARGDRVRPRPLVIDQAHRLPAVSHAFLERREPDPAERVRVVLLNPSRPQPEPGPTAAPAPEAMIRLTTREREVLVLLGRGATYQNIAELLWISVNTVKTHVSHLYAKLDAGNRSEALARARDLDLLGADYE